MPLLTIEKLTFGGAGFGHLNGKACFVPYTAPGDVAEIELSSEKKSYSSGVLKGLHSCSELRVSPPCPFFGNCGGCNWQHIAYDAQCRWKEQIFAETMWRMARIEKELIKPLLRAEEAFNYRQRIQLKVHYHNNKLLLGFYRNASHDVIDIQENCLIASRFLNNAMPELKNLLASSPEPDRIAGVDLAAGEDGSVAALLHYSGSSPDSFSGYLLSRQAHLPNINSLFLQAGGKKTLQLLFGSELLSYETPALNGTNIRLGYSIDTFSQINFRQNRALLAHFSQLFGEISAKSVLDIYCGNGNFSLPVAAAAAEVVGIEAAGKSIAIARGNAQLAGIDNVTFLSGDADRSFDSLVASGRRFDTLILDPPRSGAHNLVKKLHQLDPDHVIYVSCDPATLARDLAFLQATGFRVSHSQPVDMFPQTYHIESITLLQRS